MLNFIGWVFTYPIYWGMKALKRPGPFLAGGAILTAIAALFTPQATFITANGTTQADWQVQPTGPQLTNDGSGNLLTKTGGGTSIVNEGASSAVTLQAGISLAGTAGAGGISCGSMTGNWTLPTGSGSWTAAATKTLSLTAAGTSSISTTTGNISLTNSGSGNTVVNNTGIGSTIIECANNNGAIDIGGPAFGNNVNTLNIANDNPGSTVIIQIGDQTSTSTSQTVNILSASGCDSAGAICVGSSGTSTLLAGATSISGSVTPSIGGTLSCGTGGTVAVPAGAFEFPVTTGTLSSNCIIDFSTNAQTGMFFVDLSGATPGATFGIEFKNGTTTKTFLSSGVIAGTLATVITSGLNKLAVSY
jgi:hypothetical protein